MGLPILHVAEYDTSIRIADDWCQTLAGDPNPPTDGHLYVRRVGDRVEWGCTKITFAAPLCLRPPAGWRPTLLAQTWPWSQWDSASVRILYWSGAYWFPNSGPQWSTGNKMSTVWSHRTVDPRPTVLPTLA